MEDVITWLNSRLYRSKEKMPLILLENSLIACIANSNDRVVKVATARGVDVDSFHKMLIEKKKILNKKRNNE